MSAVQSNPLITPFLWFDANAEEAVDFYLSIFPDSRRTNELLNPTAETGVPKGKVITIAFELSGQKFIALNGGPHFKFNEAVSFVVTCSSQQEIDDYWAKLTAGGSEVQCGWLKDKFGLSWQVVPANMAELVRHPRAMEAMMTMKKLDIAALEQAGRS